MRRLMVVSLCLAALAGCKKSPRPTLPRIPDSSQLAGGDNLELPEATVFHALYRYPGRAGQVHAFYRQELEQRGARQSGDVWSDDNLVHTGDFGRNGAATPKDPSRPGVWLAVVELQEDTRIDVWESVPKAR